MGMLGMHCVGRRSSCSGVVLAVDVEAESRGCIGASHYSQGCGSAGGHWAGACVPYNVGYGARHCAVDRREFALIVVERGRALHVVRRGHVTWLIRTGKVVCEGDGCGGVGKGERVGGDVHGCVVRGA